MQKIQKLTLLVVALSLLCACSPGSKLVGNWLCDEVHFGYPDQMTLRNDGTGVVDGLSCNWSEDHGKLIISAMFSERHDYHFSG